MYHTPVRVDKVGSAWQEYKPVRTFTSSNAVGETWFLLKEDGDRLLKEDGDRILKEDAP